MAISNIFDGGAFIFLAILAGAALVILLILTLLRSMPGDSIPMRILEIVVLTLAGGLLGRAFIGLLLSLAVNQQAAATVINWAFFTIPTFVIGILQTVGVASGVIDNPNTALNLATVIGGFIGMMDGLWRIHHFTRDGVLTFLLDVTWGLSGNTFAALLHIVNVFWGWRHATDTYNGTTRTGSHRYMHGFAMKPDYALTLGNVMSNFQNFRTGLWLHETTHVWQNRVFGPFFSLTYLLYFVFTAPYSIPAGIKQYGAAGLVQGPTEIGYMSNPWEVWAYGVGEANGERARTDPHYGALVWSNSVAIGVGVIFFILIGIAAFVIITRAWQGV